MKLLAHRGYWKNESEKNSLEAIKRALENGYGFESDIRDYCGKLVISHNMADSSCPSADEVFAELERFGDRFCFAINIKADGLKDELFSALQSRNLKNYFAFDMSVPQMVEYVEKGITVFTRQSEFEKEPVLYESSAGVWIDGFEDLGWISETLLKSHIENGKRVCIVSPELHGKPHLEFWKKLNGMNLDFSQVLLCTDIPDEAKAFFGGRL